MNDYGKAGEVHAKVIALDPMYQETSHWIPVLIPLENRVDAGDWLKGNGYERGTHQARNDWLAPMGNLFLFRDAKVATEVKLRFG